MPCAYRTNSSEYRSARFSKMFPSFEQHFHVSQVLCCPLLSRVHVQYVHDILFYSLFVSEMCHESKVTFPGGVCPPTPIDHDMIMLCLSFMLGPLLVLIVFCCELKSRRLYGRLRFQLLIVLLMSHHSFSPQMDVCCLSIIPVPCMRVVL